MDRSDAFLGEFRERPRAEFAEALYHRINKPRGWQAVWRMVTVALVVVVAVTATLTVSPTARAAALSVIRRIGGVEVEETDIYPEIDGVVIEAPKEVMTLEAAQAALPFDLELPTWTPQGLTRDEDVTVIFADDRRPIATVIITWHPRLEMTVEDRGGQPAPRLVTGPGNAEEVVVNGEPAVLVRGIWNADEGTYDGSPYPMLLMWEQAGLHYTLRTWNEALSTEDLTRIAESVP